MKIMNTKMSNGNEQATQKKDSKDSKMYGKMFLHAHNFKKHKLK